MKRHRLSLFLVSLLILTSLVGIFSMNGLAQTDLNYNFSDANLYNSTSPIFNDFNLRNDTRYNGIYEASYSFTNDIDGTQNTDITPFTSVSGDDGNKIAEVIAYNDGHRKVVNFTSDGDDGQASFFNIEEIGESGLLTFEIWLKYIDNGIGNYRINLKSELNQDISQILCSSGDNNVYVYWGDGLGGNNNLGTAIASDTWFHYRLRINTATDKQSSWINGILKIDDENFQSDRIATSLEKVNFRLDGGGDTNSLEGEIDAMGFSWDRSRYANNFFDVSSEDNEPSDITWDGTNFWITGLINNDVFKYTSVGVYTGISFDVGSQDIFPQGITWDGTFFWVVGSNTDDVFKYTSAGVYTGVSFDVGSQDNFPTGITWDGTSFWVVGKTNDRVYKYTSAGIYTNISFDVSDETSDPSDIEYNDEYLLVIGYSELNIYRYTTSGVYTGIYFDISNEDIAPEGLGWNGTSIWTTGLGNINAYEYIYVEDYYFIGDNVIPLTDNLEILEIDKYEWTLNGIDSAYQHGDSIDDPQGWNSYYDNDLMKYSSSHFGTNDLTINFQGAGLVGNYNNSLVKDFNVIDGRFELAWNFYYSVMENENGGEMLVKINSYDETFLIEFNILTNSDDDSTLRYYDGTSYIDLETGLTSATWYTFNLFFESDWGVLQFTDNSGTETHYIPFDDVKDGLGTINITQITKLDDALDNNFCFIDYFSVYVNGSSVYDEGFGYRTIDFNKPSTTWNFNERHLFNIDANATLTIGGSAGNYLVDISTFDYIAGIRTYNESTFVNLYDTSSSGLLDPYLVLYLRDNYTITSIDSLDIGGVKLIQDTNEYWHIYTHASIDINESYFYVDSSNRLRGRCFYNDSNLEYIQANFDVNNVINQNRTLRFRSQFSGQYGFFSLSYIDLTSSTIKLPISNTGHNVILPQEKAIDEFVFLITDDDDLNSGYGSGLISDIELIWNPSISITIVTINLIMVMIPIIIMIVPTLTLYSRYGKSVIMPVFIFMAIICFAGGLIPAWLFFILMIGSGGFLVLKKGSDE